MLIQGRQVFVPRTVVLEAEWVLRSSYKMPRPNVIAALQGFVRLVTVEVEDFELVDQALAWAGTGMDLADALHVVTAKARGCTELYTFDKRFARLAQQLAGIVVSQP